MHLGGGNEVKHHECIRIVQTWVRIVRVWCPDIPDDSPDIPDGAMQNFQPFDVIYVFLHSSMVDYFG